MATTLLQLVRSANAGEDVRYALHDAVVDQGKSYPAILSRNLKEEDYFKILANASPCKLERKRAAKALRLCLRITKGVRYDDYIAERKLALAIVQHLLLK